MQGKHKYGAVKTSGYDSKKEYKRAWELKLLQTGGYISDLNEQVRFELLPAQYVPDYKGKLICGRRAMVYIADFVYSQKGDVVVEDVKGYRTKEYKRKARLMLKIHGIKIKET